MALSADRRAWRYWLYQARKRYGLCVIDYTVTCKHIHLLVRDQGRDEIAAGMQLIEGRTAQPFNRRKSHAGAFWQDRYHATAVETGEHLARCLVYIDLNMVRAGVVTHPSIGSISWRKLRNVRYRTFGRNA
jgi:putative transposase